MLGAIVTSISRFLQEVEIWGGLQDIGFIMMSSEHDEGKNFWTKHSRGGYRFSALTMTMIIMVQSET